MTHRAAACVCIFGSLIGFLSVPLLVVGSIKLPTQVSYEEQRTLNVQQQSALLNQRLFASEGWKYCLAGFSFLGIGMLSLGSIVYYTCILRMRAAVVPELTGTAHTLHAIVPQPTHSSSTTDVLPLTSSASPPEIQLGSPV
jgi:hypothetical protein